MKKIIWVCGVIAGLISISWPVLSENCLTNNVSYTMALVFGYAAMVLGFSLIYVGVKNYRDNLNDGLITFGKALKISLLITLVASTVYVLIWLIDFYYFIPDFSKQYIDSTRAQLVAKHTNPAEIQKQIADLTSQMQSYRKPFNLIWMTYIEILPVGLVISFIVSFILKNNKKPAIANV